MHTRNDWYVACQTVDLADRPLATTILDQAIVVWRSGDRVIALEDRCVHRAAALSLGRCEGNHLRCMYHGLLFDAAGRVVDIPGQDIIPDAAKVRCYPVAERFGWIWVWMGDPAAADIDRLPRLFDGVDINDFGMGSGVLDFEADATLISDNLLDFSHLPYVHAESFQAPLDWAETAMRSRRLERGMRFERWIENRPGFHFLEPLADTALCDEWLGYDYLVPGVLIMWVGHFPVGTARSVDFGRPDFSRAVARISTNVQAITPVSAGRARYYFTIGLHRSARSGGESAELVQRNVDVTIQAFNEDKRVIEAQQRIIHREPERPFMPTVHDKGVTLYTRLKAKLIEEERKYRERIPAAAE